MNENTVHDIEQLLQQYGNDRREQQEAATRVRKLARRQRGIAATMASVVLLVLAATWLFRTTPDTATSSPVTASVTTPNTIPQPEPITPQLSPIHKAKTEETLSPYQAKQSENQRMVCDVNSQLPTYNSQLSTFNFQLSTFNSLPVVAQAEPLSIDETKEFHLLNPESNIKPQPTTDIFSQSESNENLFALPSQRKVNEDNSQLPTPKTFRLIAEVGATMASAVAAESHAGNNRLQAGVALNMALASGRRYSLSAGVGLGGNMRTDATEMIIAKEEGYFYSPNMIDGSGIFSSNSNIDFSESIHYPYYDPLFSLYATLPLTLDLFPRGRSHTGLQLSLTPAHSIALSRHNSLFNPWKLNLGIAIALPDNPIRSIGLSANLLPSFTDGPYKSIHEIGMVIGF